ncbi:MAG TPA: hypothetical protein VJ997_01440 [Longimicrobiales bacterium]|nr:hypothetical protein [Longimicrobiales bacterium]
MREFTDQQGDPWIASVESEEGPDYKGRFYFVMRPREGGDDVALVDVRWNSERTAERTLATMSVVELRRRLRSAVGRQATPVAR